MKKFLRIISLTLMLAMLLPMTPVELFAVEIAPQQNVEEVIQNTDGTKTYTIGEYKTPIIDGAIGADEYSLLADLNPVAYCDATRFHYAKPIEGCGYEDYLSSNIDVSIAHNSDKIYIAIYDLVSDNLINETNSQNYTKYALRLGFDDENPDRFLGLYIQQTKNATESGNGIIADGFTAGGWASYYGVSNALAGGCYYWNSNSTSASGSDTIPRLKWDGTEEGRVSFPITDLKIYKEAVKEGATYDSENYWWTGQHLVRIEIEIDKSNVLDLINEANGTSLSEIDTLLFSVQQSEMKTNNAQFVWGGSFDADVPTSAGSTLAMEHYNYDKVVFVTPTEDDDFGNDNENNYPDDWTPEESVFGEFNTSTHDTSLTQLGQNIYSTGTANYTATNKMTLDGQINADEGWVCVTPNVDSVLASSYMNGASNKGWWSANNGSVNITPETSTLFAPFVGTTKYYVAQSDSKIYLAVVEEVPYVEGHSSGFTTKNDWTYTYFRLGFNAEDYKQQLVLVGESDFSAQKITTSGFASNGTLNTTITSGIVTSHCTKFTGDGVNLTTGYPTGDYTKTWEIELDKAAIISAYGSVFTKTLTNTDLNTMFIGVSHRVMLINENGTLSKGPDNTASSTKEAFKYLNGTLLTSAEATAAGENTFIPDVIVFGEEKTGSAFASCSFTGHSLEDRYLVEGTTDTYYHACTHCGMAGASTFKVANDALVYDKEIVSEDTVITAATCTAAGTYYKSCSCGRVSTSSTDIFEYTEPHDFTAKVASDGYVVKAPTCIAGGIYNVSCKVCGEKGTDTFTVNPTLWPAGAVKPVYHGQRVFYTGDANYTVKDSDIKMNDSKRWKNIEAGFVKVTPEPVKAVITNKFINTGSNATGVTITAPEDFKYYEITPEFDYYVAKSDTSIYIVFDMLYQTVDEPIGDGKVSALWTSNYRKYFHLGFNPADYTQQMIISALGNGLNADQSGILYAADADSRTQIWSGAPYTSPYFDYEICNTQNSTHRCRMYSFKIEDIKAIYLEQFGVTLTDDDFNSLFVASSNQYRAKYTDTTVTDPKDTWVANYGTVLPNGSSDEVGLTTLLPDLIVFGSEKTFCNYTAHVADDIYLVAGTTDTYYHSCPDCGDAGTKTFKYVDGAVVYNVENKDAEGATITAVTCESAGTYYKSCACGVLGTDTFAVDALGHTGATTFESDAEGHWIVCDRCNTDGAVLPVGGIKTTHNYDVEKILDNNANVADEGSCTVAPNYYKLCECGLIAPTRGEEDANIFKGAEAGHSFDDRTTKTHKAGDATCLVNETYYVECSKCHESSKDTFFEEIFEVEGTKEAHITANQQTIDAKAPTCNGIGWNEYKKCDACGYTTYEENVIAPTRWPIGTDISVSDYTYLPQYKQQVMAVNAEVEDGFNWGGTTWNDEGYNYTSWGTFGGLVQTKDDGTTGENGIKGLTHVSMPKSVAVNKDPRNQFYGSNISSATPVVEPSIAVDYYLGYDEDYIYVTVREVTKPDVDGNYYYRDNYSAKFGFNPEDYSQVLTHSAIRNEGDAWGVVNRNLSIESRTKTTQWLYGNGITYDQLKVNNIYPIADMKVSRFLYSSEADLAAALGNETGGYDKNENATASKPYAVAYFSYKLDKEAIAKAYDLAFGTTFVEDGLPNTMFITTTSSAFINDSTGTALTENATNYYLHNANLLSTDDQTAVQNNCAVLPDVIVLGAEKNSVVAPGCNFNGHETRYSAGTDKDGNELYYHYCTECGAAGARTFKIIDGSYYTSTDINFDDIVVTAVTCERAGEYVKHCSCGELDPSRETYVYEPLGHDTASAKFENDEEGHWTVCKKCDTEGAILPEGSVKTLHVYNVDKILDDEANIADEGSCTVAPNYFKLCSCGVIAPTRGEEDANIFKGEDPSHKFDDKTTKTFKKNDASCTVNEAYYVECSVCHITSEGTEFEEIFEIEGSKDAHIAANQKTESAKAPTCIAVGWNEYQYCDACGYSTYAANKIAPTRWPEGAAKPAYFGQNIFFLEGKDYTVTNEEMGVYSDSRRWEALNESLVKANNSPIKPVVITGQTDGVSKNTVNLNPDKAMYAAISPDYNYYVARSDDKVYVSFEELYNYNADGVNGQHNVLQWSAMVYRIGFNPEDPMQQLVVVFGGHALSTQTFTVKIANASKVTTLYDKDSGTVGDCTLFDYFVGGPDKGSIDKVGATRIRNFAFDKDIIKQLWKDNFDVELSDSAFDTLYVEVSNFYYGDVKVGSDYVTWTASYGAVVPSATASKYGVAGLIPETIVFGDRAPEDERCEYTHVVDDRYLVSTADDGTKTYYHSCVECGAIGGTVFKIDPTNSLPLYDANSIDAKYLAEGSSAATCTTAGIYNKNCACGAMAKDDEAYMAVEGNTATFEVVLGHNEIPHAAQAATCTSGGWNAYVTCSRCDYTTFSETSALGHSWSEWTVEPATVAATGTAVRNCSRCSTSETVTLPTLTEENVTETATVGKYTYDGTKYTFYFEDETTVEILAKYVSVNISWGTMSFVYSNRKWNPDTMSYDLGEWEPSEEGANVITVENVGTIDVNVTFVYVSLEAFENVISGSFDGVDENDSVMVVANEAKNVQLELSRIAIPEAGNSIPVGSITITINAAEDAQ